MLKFFDDYYCMKFERSSAFCKAFKITNGIGVVVFLTAVCFDSIAIVLSGIAVWVSLVLAVFAVTFLKDLVRALFLIARDELKKRYKFTYERKDNALCFSTVSRAANGKRNKKKTIVLYCETEYLEPQRPRCVVREDKQIVSI